MMYDRSVDFVTEKAQAIIEDNDIELSESFGEAVLSTLDNALTSIANERQSNDSVQTELEAEELSRSFSETGLFDFDVCG